MVKKLVCRDNMRRRLRMAETFMHVTEAKLNKGGKKLFKSVKILLIRCLETIEIEFQS